MRIKSEVEPVHAAVGDVWFDPEGLNPREKMKDGKWCHLDAEPVPALDLLDIGEVPVLTEEDEEGLQEAAADERTE